VGGNPHLARITDINSDQINDLIVPISEKILVSLLGNGKGTLDTGMFFFLYAPDMY
jgi:hypothetical protein